MLWTQSQCSACKCTEILFKFIIQQLQIFDLYVYGQPTFERQTFLTHHIQFFLMTNEIMTVAMCTGSVHGFVISDCVTLEDLYNLSVSQIFLPKNRANNCVHLIGLFHIDKVSIHSITIECLAHGKFSMTVVPFGVDSPSDSGVPF